ncbi:unnamed protein product [Prorocentrum cordatum]|uniref:Uncharacterized protein n=1 Tax=Prorocentrum cordatum TaxID=2364126 RepID=A0ABN9V8S4_9DINO|nr:unnamed protein product [Polarella glacialis]
MFYPPAAGAPGVELLGAELLGPALPLPGIDPLLQLGPEMPYGMPCWFGDPAADAWAPPEYKASPASSTAVNILDFATPQRARRGYPSAAEAATGRPPGAPRQAAAEGRAIRARPAARPERLGHRVSALP